LAQHAVWLVEENVAVSQTSAYSKREAACRTRAAWIKGIEGRGYSPPSRVNPR
jgi:hypothetical protein